MTQLRHAPRTFLARHKRHRRGLVILLSDFFDPTGYRSRIAAECDFDPPFSQQELEIFVLRVIGLGTRRRVRRIEAPEMQTVKAFTLDYCLGPLDPLSVAAQRW